MHTRWGAQNQPFQLSFNPTLRIEFQDSRVTSDGGLILVRELDGRLGLSDLIAQHIADSRSKNALFPLADLIRRSVYRRLAGYEEMNDAERLSHDPAFRLIGSEVDLGAWSRLHVPSALVRNAGHRQHRGPCLRRAGAERPTQQANGGARCCKTRQPQGWSGGGVRENWLPT